jgi:ADP-ribose pyrophosphatase YjhB (NUDIX family)
VLSRDDEGAADEPGTRVGAYAICRDAQWRLLLARCGEGEPEPGAWTLPGGGVEWGEHPDDAVVRELEEETGLRGVPGRVLGIYSRTWLRSPERPRPPFQHLGIVYELASSEGTIRAEVDGTTDACEWFARDELATVELVDLAVFGVGLVWPEVGESRP